MNTRMGIGDRSDVSFSEEAAISALHAAFNLPRHWVLKPGDPRFEWYETRWAEGEAAP